MKNKPRKEYFFSLATRWSSIKSGTYPEHISGIKSHLCSSYAQMWVWRDHIHLLFLYTGSFLWPPAQQQGYKYGQKTASIDPSVQNMLPSTWEEGVNLAVLLSRWGSPVSIIKFSSWQILGFDKITVSTVPRDAVGWGRRGAAQSSGAGNAWSHFTPFLPLWVHQHLIWLGTWQHKSSFLENSWGKKSAHRTSFSGNEVHYPWCFLANSGNDFS